MTTPPLQIQKLWTGLISQQGTNAPTVTELNNFHMGTITWSRSSQGDYRGTLENSFPINRTWIILGNVANNGIINAGRFDDDNIYISTYTAMNGGADDGYLADTPIEIRIYTTNP